MTRDISCSEMWQIIIIWKLQSDSNHRALHYESAQYHMAVRSKASKERSWA